MSEPDDRYPLPRPAVREYCCSPPSVFDDLLVLGIWIISITFLILTIGPVIGLLLIGLLEVITR